MSELRIDISGFTDFESPDTLLASVAREGIEMIREEIGRLMDLPKSGRIYGSHQASAAGEAPAKDTHALWNSYEVEGGLNSLEAELRSSLGEDGYGMILEDYRDRPSTVPAIGNVMPEFFDLVEQRIEDGWLF